MSASALIVVIAEGLIAVIAIAMAWYFASELDRLNGEHAARASVRAAEDRLVRALRTPPPLQRHTGHHRAGAALVLPLPPAQVIAEEDAEQRASAEQLPLPPVPADQPVQRRHAPKDPFTGSQPVLDDDAYRAYRAEADARQRRTDWAAMQLAALGPGATPEAVAQVLAGMRALPALRQPAFGVDRCEADVLAAEAGAQIPQVMA